MRYMINPINKDGSFVHRKFDNEDYHFEVIATESAKHIRDCIDTIQLTDRVNQKQHLETKTRQAWYKYFK